MIEKCRACGESSEEECVHCGSAIDVGELEVMFNGYLAVAMDVCLCQGCDGVWLRMGGENRLFVCSKCRQKALTVELRGPEQLRKAS
jgi:hypothetical protein